MTIKEISIKEAENGYILAVTDCDNNTENHVFEYDEYDEPLTPANRAARKLPAMSRTLECLADTLLPLRPNATEFIKIEVAKQ